MRSALLTLGNDDVLLDAGVFVSSAHTYIGTPSPARYRRRIRNSSTLVSEQYNSHPYNGHFTRPRCTERYGIASQDPAIAPHFGPLPLARIVTLDGLTPSKSDCWSERELAALPAVDRQLGPNQKRPSVCKSPLIELGLRVSFPLPGIRTQVYI